MDLWRIDIFWVLIASVLVICSRIKPFGPGVALWGYLLISSLFVFCNPYTEPHDLYNQFTQSTAQAFAEIALFPAMIFMIPSRYFQHWKKAAVLLAVYETCALLVKGYGLMLAPSFDASLIAMILPLAHPVLMFFFVIAIIKAKGATAALILFAQLIGMAFNRRAKIKAKLSIALFAISLMVVTQGAAIMQGTGRVQAWQRFFEWWGRENHQWLGTGQGTFIWLGPYLDGFKGVIFLHMHNDWLQLLFEGGIVGLSLGVVYFIWLLSHAIKKRFWVTVLFGCAACMMTYHPWHFVPSILFMLCVAREIEHA